MKKSKLLMLAVLLTACVAMFCACNLFVNAKDIVVESMPKTSYVTSDTDFDWTGFKLRVEYNNSEDSKVYTYEQLASEGGKSFSVSKFDNSVGTHTATINYLGCSVSFAYTVADKLFAGGEGTAANPYQIATAEQFANIGRNESVTYFKLINDLDMTDYAPAKNYNDNKSYAIENAVVDGDNYALRNLTTYVADHLLDGATVKNFDMYINYIPNSEGYTPSVFSRIGKEGNEISVLENINIYGTKDMSGVVDQNEGILTVHMYGKKLTVKNVDIYADLISNQTRGAAFIGGYINEVDGEVIFDECNFYGYAQARRIGLFFGNHQNKGTITIINSKNYGTLVATECEPAIVNYAYNEYDIKTTITVDNGVIATEEENLASKCNAEGAKTTRIYDAKLALTVGENKQFSVTAAENISVSYYKVFAEVWTGVYYGADRVQNGTFNFTLLESEKITTATAINVYCYDWKLDTTLAKASERDDTNKCYIFNDSLLFGGVRLVALDSVFTVTGSKNVVKYTVYAYDVEGMILGSYTYVA